MFLNFWYLKTLIVGLMILNFLYIILQFITKISKFILQITFWFHLQVI